MKWAAVITAVLSLCLGTGLGFLLASGRASHGQAGAHDEGAAKASPVKPDDKSEDKGGEKTDGQEAAAICRVRVAKLERGDLPLPIIAFGTVVVAPAGIVQVVAPYDCIIRNLLVVEGAVVAADTTLVEVKPSPDTLAQHNEALLTRAAAERELEQTKQRLELRLATAQELSQAQSAVDLARLKVQTWEQRLADSGRCTSASVIARVGKLLVRVGQQVPVGTPLVELQLVAGLNELEVRIGLDPADAARVKPGQAVSVTALRRTAGAPWALMFARLATQVTPETRLLDAIVPVPPDPGLVPGASLMAGEAVRADIPLTLPDALIVPRQALVRSDDGWVVFTAVARKDEHHAVRHAVMLVAENRTQAAISAATDGDLKPGDAVIIEGNTVVTEGMEVEVLAGEAP